MPDVYPCLIIIPNYFILGDTIFLFWGSNSHSQIFCVIDQHKNILSSQYPHPNEKPPPVVAGMAVQMNLMKFPP